MNELKFHYSNPKFKGKPWAVDQKPKRNKKRKKIRRRIEFIHPFESRVREYLKDFWELFDHYGLNKMRVTQMACDPGWPRVEPALRKRLRRQFSRRYTQYLVDIGEDCAICGIRPWKEKHHVVPLCYGGINDNLNLMGICMECHNDIHPWLKD